MPTRYWIFVTLMLLLTAFIAYATYTTARLLRDWRPERNLLLLPGENVLRIALVAACVGLGLLSGLDAAQLGWVWIEPGRQIAWGLFLGALLAAIFYVTTNQIMARTGQRFYSSVVLETIVPHGRREFLLVMLAMIPVVLLEELLFRSLLIGGLSPVLPTNLLVVGSGVLFGWMHRPQGVWGMTGAGLAGLFFGALFLQQGSLLILLVAHYVANLVQIGLAMRKQESTSDGMGAPVK